MNLWGIITLIGLLALKGQIIACKAPPTHHYHPGRGRLIPAKGSVVFQPGGALVVESHVR